MAKRTDLSVPQVLTVEALTGNGKIRIKKPVRQHLGKAGPLYLVDRGEILITPGSGADGVPVPGSLAELGGSTLDKLEAEPGDLVAFVERLGAVALKKIILDVEPAMAIRVYDIEEPYRITRRVETNAMPDTLIPALVEAHAEQTLPHDVHSFLAGRTTLDAWRSRQLLGIAGAADAQLQDALVAERLEEQAADGAWSDDPVQTARHLRELWLLGLTPENCGVRKGAEWLLDRPESAANPGMFFLTDRLVARQADILAKRQAIREGRQKASIGAVRFAGRTPSEAKRLLAGDDLIEASCGTRIMWPNALALEALLCLGYEEHPRVERALESLMHGYLYWCECNYQIGAGTHRWREIPGDRELAEREDYCTRQFVYGSRPEPEEYLESKRIRQDATGVFALKVFGHVQPCETITTRALSHAKSSVARRAAAAHMWRFAGFQNPEDGTFASGEYVPVLPFMLQVFSRFDHPASQVAILRAIPWVIDNQNADGSWGPDGKKDAWTLAVVEALHAIGEHLPRLMPA